MRDHIDDGATKGANCSKRNSTATDGTWTYETDGTVINCTDNTGEVLCERGPGSVTLYTKLWMLWRGDLIQMAFTHVVLKGAVLVLECIKWMTYKISFQTVS